MQTYTITRFVNSNTRPSKLCLLINPIPTAWSHDYSPLSRIAVRLMPYGIVTANEQDRNKVTIELFEPGWLSVSRVLEELRTILRDCFGSHATGIVWH